jgi:hypothetical protein
VRDETRFAGFDQLENAFFFIDRISSILPLARNESDIILWVCTFFPHWLPAAASSA